MKQNTERPLSQSQYRIRISAMGGGNMPDLTDVYFTSFSGIQDQSQVVQYADPHRQKRRATIGARQISDVQIMTPFKSKEHQKILEAWNLYQCEELQIEVQPITCGARGSQEETPIGEPFILTGCLWSGCRVAEANRDGNDVSRLTLTFSVDWWYRGQSGAPAATNLNTNV
jgi:hypothetical protein